MRTMLFVAVSIAIALPTVAQDVGQSLPQVELGEMVQTPAGSYDEFLGRTVLIEFFAYW